MNAKCHVSLTQIVDFFGEVLGAKISKGTLSKVRPAVSESLQFATSVVFQEVQVAPIKFADETGWKNAGVREYLWTVTTNSESFYAILPSHSRKVAEGLLGKDLIGIVMTDGFKVYDFLPEDQHGRCCAHLQRNFQDFAERSDPDASEFGNRGVEILNTLFLIIQDARRELLSKTALWEKLWTIKQRLGKLLWKGNFSKNLEVQRFAGRIRSQWKSWFLFSDLGLDSTNNTAERALRPGVIWRKISMGSRSDEGTVYVSRILTTLETAKKRKVKIMPFLTGLIRCTQHGIKAPQISLPPAKVEKNGRG